MCVSSWGAEAGSKRDEARDGDGKLRSGRGLRRQGILRADVLRRPQCRPAEDLRERQIVRRINSLRVSMHIS